MFGEGIRPSHPDRRYPPTPYPPHSPATAAYRDAYDLGWQHYATLRAQVLDHEKNLEPGPRKRGYRDGVIARYMYEERMRKSAAKAAALERQRMREEARQAAESEPPY